MFIFNEFIIYTMMLIRTNDKKVRTPDLAGNIIYFKIKQTWKQSAQHRQTCTRLQQAHPNPNTSCLHVKLRSLSFFNMSTLSCQVKFVQEETDCWADVEQIHFSPGSENDLPILDQLHKCWSHADIFYSNAAAWLFRNPTQPKTPRVWFYYLSAHGYLKAGASFCKVVWRAQIQETEPFKRRWGSW